MASGRSSNPIIVPPLALRDAARLGCSPAVIDCCARAVVTSGWPASQLGKSVNKKEHGERQDEAIPQRRRDEGRDHTSAHFFD